MLRNVMSGVMIGIVYVYYYVVDGFNHHAGWLADTEAKPTTEEGGDRQREVPTSEEVKEGPMKLPELGGLSTLAQQAIGRSEKGYFVHTSTSRKRGWLIWRARGSTHGYSVLS